MKYTDALYSEENTLNANDLETKYSPVGDGEHPNFPRQLWRLVVMDLDTISGYWDWVFNQIQSWEPDQDDADREAQYRQKAIAMYADGSNDTIEMDENCAVSVGEDGAFVAAWVWVPESSL
jgi:hypothetical protein